MSFLGQNDNMKECVEKVDGWRQLLIQSTVGKEFPAGVMANENTGSHTVIILCSLLNKASLSFRNINGGL